jgi:hypothetical protein
MAYTAIATKESVSKLNDSIYQVTIKLVVNDGASEVFSESVSEQYNNNAPDLTGIKARLLEQLRVKWDKYKAEHLIYVAGAFDTMVSEIQTTANAYINA